MYLSVLAVVKAFRGFEADAVHIVIAVLVVAVGLVFGVLGVVLAVGWAVKGKW